MNSFYFFQTKTFKFHVSCFGIVCVGGAKCIKCIYGVADVRVLKRRGAMEINFCKFLCKAPLAKGWLRARSELINFNILLIF